MRSYYAHLGTDHVLGKNKDQAIAKPIFRASAIFPVMHYSGVSSRILFLGYWILKRHIQQVACVVTLRSEGGALLIRSHFLISEAKAYRVELAEMLSDAGYGERDFFGSLEVEFFSTVNLVFPYPAVSINYYGPQFSSAVHTAQRVYNDFEDMRNNSQTVVPESGFNLYCDEKIEPLIGMINGPEKTPEGKIQLEVFNVFKEQTFVEIELNSLEPYQTLFIYPAKLMPLREFLKGSVGSAKLTFHLNWIFPRLMVGNVHHGLPAISLTHTYYDCTEARKESDYWLKAEPEWHPATLMIPVCIDNDSFTNIYFYPIYSPSSIIIDLELYEESGKRIAYQPHLLQIDSPSKEFVKVDIKALCRNLNMTLSDRLGARIIAKSSGNGRIPSRIKVSLDMGRVKQTQMPCNICTNLQPFNPTWETKPSTFKWSPILADKPGAFLWIMNSGPHIHLSKSADIVLTFFREKDSTSLSRKIVIPPHGFYIIELDNDKELKEFFDDKVGWCTMTSTNPYTTSYYFSVGGSGVVGGDHCF